MFKLWSDKKIIYSPSFYRAVGGKEAEKEEREKWVNKEKKAIKDSVAGIYNYLLFGLCNEYCIWSNVSSMIMWWWKTYIFDCSQIFHTAFVHFSALLNIRNKSEQDHLRKELVEKQKEEGKEGPVEVPDKVDWLYGTKQPPTEDDAEEQEDESDLITSNRWEDDPDNPENRVSYTS